MDRIFRHTGKVWVETDLIWGEEHRLLLSQGSVEPLSA